MIQLCVKVRRNNAIMRARERVFSGKETVQEKKKLSTTFGCLLRILHLVFTKMRFLRWFRMFFHLLLITPSFHMNKSKPICCFQKASLIRKEFFFSKWDFFTWWINSMHRCYAIIFPSADCDNFCIMKCRIIIFHNILLPTFFPFQNTILSQNKWKLNKKKSKRWYIWRSSSSKCWWSVARK